jgi:hypothetical protein
LEESLRRTLSSLPFFRWFFVGPWLRQAFSGRRLRGGLLFACLSWVRIWASFPYCLKIFWRSLLLPKSWARLGFLLSPFPALLLAESTQIGSDRNQTVSKRLESL